MEVVGVQDAHAQFALWLQRVESGEEVVITRDGCVVARMVPAQPRSGHISPAAAIAEMQQMASRNRLHGLQVKELAAEGRR